jgi:hypothetical protein
MAADWNDETVARLPLARGRAELLEEIMSTSATDTIEHGDRERRHGRWLVPAAAAAAVAVVAVLVTVTQQGDDTSSRPAGPAASSTATADAGPATQLILGAPGWEIGPSTVDEQEQEISYDQGDLGIDVKRIPAAPGLSLDDIAEEHRDVTTPPSDGTPAEVAGLAARSWSYAADDRVVSTEARDGFRYEIRASGMDDAAFAALLPTLSLVDEAAFEASLPDDFVLPSEREAAVADVLDGITEVSGSGLPAGATPPTTFEVDRYQVVADVAMGYACAWFDVYLSATSAGDEAAAAQAGRVLGSSVRWPAVVEVDPDGEGFGSVLWMLTQRAADGEPIRPGDLRDGLGCELG